MSDKQTGGSVFPIVGQWGVTAQGMTLRDYFAAKAMSTLVHNRTPWDAASEAYQYADAMLKARDAHAHG